jgi:uncharacterized tellurite resistance protein B-like protein
MTQNDQLLQGYSGKERAAYLAAIASIASVDRQASNEEIDYLQALGKSADLNDGEMQQVIEAAKDSSNLPIQTSLAILKNSDLRFSLITNLISFAKSDGKYSAEEQQKVQEIATYLQIGQTQFHALHTFVDQAEEAKQQGQDVTSQHFLQNSGLSEMLQRNGISTNGVMRGLLGIVAPVILGRILNTRGKSSGGMGNTGGLEDILANSIGGRNQQSRPTKGGLGSIFDAITGGRGYQGMGGLLGSLLGSRR